MQENKEEKYAPIKGRVHIWLKQKGITHDVFFSSLNISTSTFKGKSGKSEFGGEILARIVALYPTMSTRWLLTGEGSMERNENAGNIQIHRNKLLGRNNVVAINHTAQPPAEETKSPLVTINEYLLEQCAEKDRQILSLLKTIDTLSRAISDN